jgi:hypothetical protein
MSVNDANSPEGTERAPMVMIAPVGSVTQAQLKRSTSGVTDQDNEIKVMHFPLNLWRTKDLYIFEHYLLILTATVPQATYITRAQYTKCRLSRAS